jgi:hypothetical protein
MAHHMKTIVIAFGLVVLAGALAWVMYPTSLPARQQVYRPVPTAEFRAIRSLAIGIARSGVGAGVELEAGDEASHALLFSCNGVPLVSLMNSEQALVVMEFAGFDTRAPGLAAKVGVLSDALVPMQATPARSGMPSEPTGFESFVLKHRDGLDLAERCEG